MVACRYSHVHTIRTLLAFKGDGTEPPSFAREISAIGPAQLGHGFADAVRERMEALRPDCAPALTACLLWPRALPSRTHMWPRLGWERERPTLLDMPHAARAARRVGEGSYSDLP